MCGLLAYFSTDADRVDDADGRRRCATPSTACATAAPTRRRPGRTPGPSSASTGCRSSTSSTATSRCPTPTAATGSSSTARSTTTSSCAQELRRGRRHLRHRGRHRGDRRRLPPVGRGRRPAAARHVRLRHLGQPDRTRCSAPATRSASSRCSPPGSPTAAIVFSSEKKALLELLGGSKAAGGVDPASLQHYLTLQYVPGARDPAPRHPADRERHAASPSSTASCTPTRYFHPTLPDPAGRARTRSRRSTTGSPTCSTTRCAMHMRADVTVGSFLSGGIDSTAIAALAKRYNPKLMTFTDRLRARGLLRDRRRRGVRGGDRRRAHHQGRSPPRSSPSRSRWSSGTSTTRSPTRRWCRCGSSPARPASTSRWCSPARAPTSCSAATTSTASRCRLAGVREAAGRRPPRAGRAVDPAARRDARQGPAPPRRRSRSRSGTTATPGSSGTTSWASCARPRPRPVARDGDPGAVPAHAARPATTTSPRCSTSTCSPGCAATSWSRPTR